MSKYSLQHEGIRFPNKKNSMADALRVEDNMKHWNTIAQIYIYNHLRYIRNKNVQDLDLDLDLDL